MASRKGLREKSAPSQRDLEVYRRVVIEARTQRGAALEFGISQGRVCQVIKRVQEWIQETPGDDEQRTPQERLRLAIYVHKQRLDHAWREAMEAWRHSLEDQVTQRAMEEPDGRYYERVVRPGVGKVQFLNAAVRLVEKIARYRGVKLDTEIPWDLEPIAQPKEEDPEALAAEFVQILETIKKRAEAAEREAQDKAAAASAELNSSEATAETTSPPAADYSNSNTNAGVPANIASSVEPVTAGQPRPYEDCRVPENGFGAQSQKANQMANTAAAEDFSPWYSNAPDDRQVIVLPPGMRLGRIPGSELSVF